MSQSFQRFDDCFLLINFITSSSIHHYNSIDSVLDSIMHGRLHLQASTAATSAGWLCRLSRSKLLVPTSRLLLGTFPADSVCFFGLLIVRNC